MSLTQECLKRFTISPKPHCVAFITNTIQFIGFLPTIPILLFYFYFFVMFKLISLGMMLSNRFSFEHVQYSFVKVAHTSASSFFLSLNF